MDIQTLGEYLAKILIFPIREYGQDKALKRIFGEFNAFSESFKEDTQAITYYQQKNGETQGICLYSEDETTILVIKENQSKNFFLLGTLTSTTFSGEKKVGTALDLEVLLESGLLLFAFLTGEKRTAHELLMSCNEQNFKIESQGKIIADTRFQYQEYNLLHNPYSQELREQGSIREGNLEKLIKSFDESYSGKLATLSKDKLRSVKNLGIVVLAISTRAAIEGGLHPEQAFLLSDSYILSVDEALSEADIYRIVRGAEINFTKLVAKNKNQKELSPTVARATNMIFQRMHEKISLAELAAELKTTSSYLSTVFKKETGITVHQFIIQEKLKIAENLLCYSHYKIEEIANYLAFSSQSHFGHLFKKQYGLTPNRYRIKYGIEEG